MLPSVANVCSGGPHDGSPHLLGAASQRRVSCIGASARLTAASTAPWARGLIGVQISTVDPRDQTWEIDNPVFRVYFHDDDGTSYEHAVRDGNVEELLAWAGRFAEGRTFVVYVCVPRDGLGLIQLIGKDPNAA
jgi:hypothetical protein